MSSTEAIPCCCEQKKYLCCVDVTATYACAKGTVDSANCTVSSGGNPEFRTLTGRVQTCAATKEECNCNLVDPCIFKHNMGLPCADGEGNILIDSCHSTFYPGVPCTGPEADSKCKSDISKVPCSKMSCGPCGPYFEGCVDADSNGNCPPIPNCEKQPCCNQTPDLCCFTTITNGCLTDQHCGPCNGGTSSGTGQNGTAVTKVQDCSSCSSNQQGRLIVTGCCGSFSDGTECGRNHDCGSLPCCYTCASDPNCLSQKCIYPCDGWQDPRPLCDCPIVSSAGATCANYFESTFTDNRYTSGFVKANSGINELNTLFLFGYGYNHL